MSKYEIGGRVPHMPTSKTLLMYVGWETWAEQAVARGTIQRCHTEHMKQNQRHDLNIMVDLQHDLYPVFPDLSLIHI